jgi:hypothetical protein
MQKIVSRQTDAPSPAEATTRRRRNRRPVGSREVLAFFAGAAAVALFAILSPDSLSRRGPSPAETVGSIGLAAQDEVVDRWSWSEAWGEGEATLSSQSGEVVLRLQCAGPKPASFTVHFDATQWEASQFAGFGSARFERAPEPGRVDVTTDRGDVAELGFRPLGPSPAPPWIEIQVRTPGGGAGGRLDASRTGESDSRTNFRD